MEGKVYRGENEVTVILENGFRVDFFLLNLTNEEYISSANQIYEIENK